MCIKKELYSFSCKQWKHVLLWTFIHANACIILHRKFNACQATYAFILMHSCMNSIISIFEISLKKHFYFISIDFGCCLYKDQSIVVRFYAEKSWTPKCLKTFETKFSVHFFCTKYYDPVYWSGAKGTRRKIHLLQPFLSLFFS